MLKASKTPELKLFGPVSQGLNLASLGMICTRVHQSLIFHDFSRLRSNGSRLTLALCSLDGAQPFATVRNRSQPFATVRNRSRDCHMAVPMGSFSGGVICGGFQRHVASFRVAGVALRGMWTCLVTCRKSFSMAGAILLRCCQKMSCIFRDRHNFPCFA